MNLRRHYLRTSDVNGWFLYSAHLIAALLTQNVGGLSIFLEHCSRTKHVILTDIADL